MHKITRSWTSVAVAVLVAEFSLGAAAQTPQDRWDYAFRVDASAGNGFSGHAPSLASAESSIRSQGGATLTFERSTTGPSGLVTRHYVARPTHSDPAAGTWEYYFAGCNEPNVCLPAKFGSREAFQAAYKAWSDSQHPNYCSSQWVQLVGGWHQGAYTVNFASPRIGNASQTWQLQRSGGVSCTSVQPMEIHAERTLTCPPYGSTLSSVDPVPEQACHNTATATITFYEHHEAQPHNCGVGNPCDPATGSKTQTVVDHSGPGPAFVRTYQSEPFYARPQYGGLGYGWYHNYQSSILTASTGVPEALVRGDGTTVALLANGTNAYSAANGSGLHLRKVNQGIPGAPYLLTFKWVLTLPSGETEEYQCHAPCTDAGVGVWQLRTMKTASGVATAASYSSATNDPVAVSDQFGHQLVFVYSGPESCPASNEDCVGRLDYITRADGVTKIVDFTFDATPDVWGQRLTTVAYPGTESESYQYAGSVQPGQYGGAGYRLQAVTDGKGVAYASFTYHGDGRAKSTEHAGGVQKFTLTYNGEDTPSAADDTTTVVDADGNTVTYDYSAYTDGPRQQTSITYQDNSTIEQMSEPDGQRRLTDRWFTKPGIGTVAQRHFTYDNHHVTGITDFYESSSPRQTTFEYAFPENSLPRFVKAPSTVAGQQKWTETVYCTNSTPGCPVNRPYLPWKVIDTTRSATPPYAVDTDQPTRATTYGYNSIGHVTSIDGPRPGAGDVTTIEWWEDAYGGTCLGGGECGQVKKITDAAGHDTSYTYYADSALVHTVVTASGVTVTYTYNGRGRVETITESAPGESMRTTHYEFDAAGLVDSVQLPNGLFLDYTWTAAHLLDFVVDNAGNKIQYGYDLRGNQTSVSMKTAAGVTARVDSAGYDPRNYLNSRSLGSRPASSLTVDITGQLQSATDPGEPTGTRLTDPQYDERNRLWKIVYPAVPGAAAPTVSYGYDAADNLTSIEAPNGATTHFIYDDLGNLREESSNDRGITEYGFDEAGNMTCRADGRYVSSSVKCDVATEKGLQAYDGVNRVTSVDYSATGPGADVSFQYDTRPGSPLTQAGRLREVSTQSGPATVTRKMDHDAWGNVTWSQQSVTGGATRTTQYQYNGMNQLMAITYPSGRVVNYQRYTNGRIKAITATKDGYTQPVVTSVSYQPFGPVKSINYGNGTVQIRETDTAGAPGSIQLVDTATFEGLDSRSYTVSQAGNITRLADELVPANSRDFGYDNLDRLAWDSGVSASNPTYSHDANGNRLTRAAGTFPAQGFTYSPGSSRDAAASYDGMGNLLANLAVYNAAGRLASITDPELGDELQLTYNGLGELAQTVQYHPDCNSTPTLFATEDFTFAPDGRVLSIRTARNVSYETDYVWLDDLPVAQFVDSYDSQVIYIGTDVMYLHPDHLGTPRTGTTPWKSIAWRYRSDAFGIPGAETSMQVRLRLPGQIALGVAGIHYNYYRDYEPETGRYLESDPVGLEGGLNTYSYALQNPLFHSDNFGLDVLQQSHPVALGQNHAKLVLVPINQDRWRGDPRFNNVLPDGRRYAALGAGPEGGYLVSNFNRERDIQLDHNVSSEACVVPDRYGSEDELIMALLAIDETYGDRADYEWFPSRFSDGYNSNSYIGGLLRAAGVVMPAPPSTPGYDKPLPIGPAK